MENHKNVSQDIRDQLNAKAEAVQIILTGIDNDIYSTVDACPNACEMWKAIERFYKMMNELIRNQCDVTNHQVNGQFLLPLQAEWQRGKAIVNSPPPIYDQEPTMVAKDDEMSKENEIDKLMDLISLSFKKIYKLTNNNLLTSSNTSRANQDNSSRINRGTGYDTQRIVNVARARENVEKADWRDNTDDKPNDQELEAHYMYMAQFQEVTPDAADNSGPVFDSEPLQKDDDDDDLANERDLLASLIEKLKCEIDDSKNRNKFLETSNKDLVDKLKEKAAQFKFYKTREDKEFDKVIALENKVKVLDNIVYKIGQSVQTMNMLNRNCKTSFAKPEFLKKAQRANLHLINADLEKFHLCLKEEMVADLRYFNSLELEVDSLKSQLETQKTQFLNEIDQLSREYHYADHMNAILGVYTELDKVTNLQCDYLETLEKSKCLEKELSKSKIMSNSFEALQKHAINLELDLQQCKEKIKNDKCFKENQSKEFRKEREQYFEIQDLKAQLQDKGIAISELKKLIEKLKGKSVETKFEISSVIRQPNAFKSQRPSILGKPTIFLDSLEKKDCSKSKSVTKNNVSNDFSKPVTA
nr:hypothetical protein [Tanacetum cinerariifolium]